MKAYSTKYALTTGIDEVDLEIVEEVWGFTESYETCFRNWYKKGRDWHETRESALARAEEMRKEKIASLRKQIAKLEAMRFGEEPKT